MSEISNWILQITGIVLCGVLVEVLLPKGKLNKILKTILALFIVMVIIAPLKNSDIAKLNFSNIFGELNIDKSFVERREGEKIEMLEQMFASNLKNCEGCLISQTNWSVSTLLFEKNKTACLNKLNRLWMRLNLLWRI